MLAGAAAETLAGALAATSLLRQNLHSIVSALNAVVTTHRAVVGCHETMTGLALSLQAGSVPTLGSTASLLAAQAGRTDMPAMVNARHNRQYVTDRQQTPGCRVTGALIPELVSAGVMMVLSTGTAVTGKAVIMTEGMHQETSAGAPHKSLAGSVMSIMRQGMLEGLLGTMAITDAPGATVPVLNLTQRSLAPARDMAGSHETAHLLTSAARATKRKARSMKSE